MSNKLFVTIFARRKSSVISLMNKFKTIKLSIFNVNAIEMRFSFINFFQNRYILMRLISYTLKNWV